MSSAGSGQTEPSPAAGVMSGPEHTYLFPRGRGHTRSVSHGGSSTLGAPRSALRPPSRGHQRALSQGQLPPEGPARPGHSRAGSRTDFILPPSHRDPPPPSALNLRPSARGHSRQASRSESIYTLRRNSGPSLWRRAVGWMLRRPPAADERRYFKVYPNHVVPPKTPKKEHPNGKRIDNKVRTTKYTLLSFIPKNLLEQFHRVANLYFILIVLLNWFPSINAFGKEVAMIPVLFVLGVTAVKDLFEDRRRHISDKRINNSTCRVYKSSIDRYKKVLWKDVRVGDLVHLSNNEVIPADLVLLRSSDPSGLCYLDTCNLDGESNLKPRQVVSGFQDKQSTFTAGNFVSLVEVDAPSTKIYRFHGAVVHPKGGRVPLSSDNLLLRECRVKNTDYVEGIVVYAGHETKAMLNNGGPRYKRSRLERQMNTDVIWCVLMLLVMCCVGAVACKLWLDKQAPAPVSATQQGPRTTYGLPTSPQRPLPPYIPYAWEPAYEGLLSFWTFIIILQVMIPLSLYVTIEMTKIVQIYHIHNNVDLYDPTTDKRIECRALNITEELGQIEYIFSDKTGTLTENKMVFRRCAINGVDYNHSSPERTQHPMGSPVISSEPATPITANPQLVEELSSEHVTEGSHAQHVREFLLVLALCNTVVVSHTPHHDNMDASGVVETPPNPPNPRMPKFIVNGTKIKNKQTPLSTEKYSRLAESRSVTPSPPPSALPSPRTPSALPTIPHSPPDRPRFLQIPSLFNRERNAENGKSSLNSSVLSDFPSSSPRPIFEAESPDELALVEAACAYGCRLEKRTPREVIISMNREFVSIPVLAVLPFDSTRKCMSIAVRMPNSSEVTIYSKGADSTLLEVLAPSPEGSVERAALMRTQQQLDSYGRQGLRTLVIAKRTLTIEEFEEWAEDLKNAELSIDNRERKVRDCYGKLENNFILLGATGIEDRLQEGVPQTIAALLEAGIVVWVLTGDKPETAINVAYSAKLFPPQVELLKLMARSKSQAESTIKCYLDSMDNIGVSEDGNSIVISPLPSRSSKGRALVVDGKTLTFILDKRSNLTGPFLELTRRCISVLCCRATPLQKAYIVKVVKEEMGVTTLAIGDGANDVSMIQTADVGIGISGMEGMQAVMASDFAISRFKYLERFLLVHGHWCYNRLARMILYFFYKNATFVFLVFWFQLFCGWSACVMVDQMFLMLYNLFFTSLPPLAIGVYDRCAPEALLLERPGLYAASRLGSAYRPRSYWLAMLDALYQSIALFFTALHCFWGSPVDLYVFGTTISSSCIIIMLCHVAIETRSWTILHVLSLLGSLFAFYGFSLIYGSICVQCMGLPSNYWIMQTAMATPEYWLVIVLSTVIALTPRLVWRSLSASLWPGALGRAVLQRRRDRKLARLPLAAHYHNASHSTHIYRPTVEDTTRKRTTLTAIG